MTRTIPQPTEQMKKWKVKFAPSKWKIVMGIKVEGKKIYCPDDLTTYVEYQEVKAMEQ